MEMSSVVSDRPLLTVVQVAERLAVCEKTVRRLIDRGDLPVLRVGGSIRIEPAQLEAWLHAGDVMRLEQEILAAHERGDTEELERLRAAYRRLGSFERPVSLLRVEEVEHDG
jgi:excisionase family DNA binding protein